jgi:DNA topoisomerase-6 subunit B
MGARQREISVSEFIPPRTGTSSVSTAPGKALLTCVTEAVDQTPSTLPKEAGILPDVVVKVEVVPSNGSPPPPASQATRFPRHRRRQRPGHRPPVQIPPIFAKLL